MSQPQPAVRLSGVVKRYGDVLAVDGIDLEVRRGECFGLLGPNGAGKTTTVEILEGILAPDEGDVEVLGARWGAETHRLRARLGIQLQESHFPEKLTVEETLRLFRSFYPHGLPPDEVMATIGLTDKRRAWVRTLSGGQRQRLSLGVALVGAPEMLFLDEPTTGLDPQSRRSVWQIVERFRAGGGTVLLTTHYMEEAQRLCDRVAIVDRGRVIAQGSPRELIGRLGAAHVVEAVVAGDAPPDADLARLPGVAAAETAAARLRLTTDEPHRAIPALLADLAARGLELRELTTHHASLEDVFVALTGRHLRDG
ncbi:MAG: ABC transporter ATP-binding protein [Acidobacteria bacterium]|nr:MAG: ABC transporter ATP-binding protein [Acidobacteriota bacterium]